MSSYISPLFRSRLGRAPSVQLPQLSVRVPPAQASRAAHPAQRGSIQLLSQPEFALDVQQQPVQVVDRGERVRMPIAEGLTPCLQRLAAQRYGLFVLALFHQQHAEVVNRVERVLVPIAEG